MNCYICGTKMTPTEIIHKGKTIPAMKCPKCNDEYTTTIHAKDLPRKKRFE
jgi:uncharacterized Zn finger protein